jgi:hypothetical protein
MSELLVSRDDLDSFAPVLAGLTGVPEGPKALLSQLVTDIRAAMGDLEETAVTVEAAPDEVEPDTESLIGEQFANAFEAADAPSGHAVKIRLHKVHR